jgi:hypothetical protein
MVTPNLGGKHSNVAITVAANTFTDVAGNTNTTIAKNTTKISNLKELVNINGIGSDVDLTHWDVSHVSDAHKAFYSAKVLSILFRVIALPLNIPVAFFKLEISQLPISWLKALAL